MDSLGVFNYLPDDELRLVLENLSLRDIANFRCTSKAIENRVTQLMKSKLNKLHIKGINSQNCKEISRTLSIAMDKLNAPEKLELQFVLARKLNRTMRQISVDYKDNITSLDIRVNGNEELLLQPSFLLKSLESLSLSGFKCNDDTMISVCEAMMDKYADNLKNLDVTHLKRNLRVPALPKLDTLCLSNVDKEAGLTILNQCRPTITSLDLYCTHIEISSLNNDGSNNSTVYRIPNVRHMRIDVSNGLQFLLFNAKHLVSLELGIIPDITEDVVWPHFPELRELSIYEPQHLPILKNCRQSLELLVIDYINSNANMVMPKLSDLYMNDISGTFTRKVCSSNHRILEFLHLCDVAIPDLAKGMRMERMMNVVLQSSHHHTYTAQDRERMMFMCPNAEVNIMSKENKDQIRDQVKTRFKRKNFSMSFLRFKGLD